jgi:hypothetical protein
MEIHITFIIVVVREARRGAVG